jgi:hypothetical protein
MNRQYVKGGIQHSVAMTSLRETSEGSGMGILSYLVRPHEENSTFLVSLQQSDSRIQPRSRGVNVPLRNDDAGMTS